MQTLTVMDVKTTLAHDCKHFNSTFSLHGIHPHLLKRNIYTWVFVLHKWNIYTNSICTSAYTRRFSSVTVRLVKHRPVPGRASADLYRDFRKFLALFTHRTSPLKSYDLSFKPKSSGARPMCANAGRAPYTDVNLLLITLQNALRTPWNLT